MQDKGRKYSPWDESEMPVIQTGRDVRVSCYE